MKVIQIFCDGSMDEIEVSPKNIHVGLTEKSKSQGDGEIRFLYSWLYEQSKIECYGWFDGEAGFENKHELPPSGNSNFLDESSCQLLFGDLFIAMKTGDTYKSLDVGEYSEFYSYVHGGFDDCEEMTSDSEPNTSEEDEDFTPGGDCDTEDVLFTETQSLSGESEEEFITETETDDSELEPDASIYEI